MEILNLKDLKDLKLTATIKRYNQTYCKEKKHYYLKKT